jgi:hypothetical protein
MQTNYYILTSKLTGKQFLSVIKKKIQVFYYYNDDVFKNSIEKYNIDINLLSTLKDFLNFKEITKQEFNYLIKNEPENYCINR